MSGCGNISSMSMFGKTHTQALALALHSFPGWLCVGGVILALIEGIGIALTRAQSKQYKPGE